MIKAVTKNWDPTVFKIVEFSETLSDRYPKKGSPLTEEDREALLAAIAELPRSPMLKRRLTAGDAQQVCDALQALVTFR